MSSEQLDTIKINDREEITNIKVTLDEGIMSDENPDNDDGNHHEHLDGPSSSPSSSSVQITDTMNNTDVTVKMEEIAMSARDNNRDRSSMCVEDGVAEATANNEKVNGITSSTTNTAESLNQEMIVMTSPEATSKVGRILEVRTVRDEDDELLLQRQHHQHQHHQQQHHILTQQENDSENKKETHNQSPVATIDPMLWMMNEYNQLDQGVMQFTIERSNNDTHNNNNNNNSNNFHFSYDDDDRPGAYAVGPEHSRGICPPPLISSFVYPTRNNGYDEEIATETEIDVHNNRRLEGSAGDAAREANDNVPVSNDDLVHAQPVVEDDYESQQQQQQQYDALSEAYPVHHEGISEQEQEQAKGNRLKGLIALCFVWTVIISAAAASAIIKSRDNDVPSEEEGEGENPVSLPVVDRPPKKNESDTKPMTPLQDVLDLPDYTLENMLDVTTPQFRAYHWLVNDPNLNKKSPERRLQRFALATFHYATHGNDWTVRGTRLGGEFWNVSTGVQDITTPVQRVDQTRQPGIDGPIPYRPEQKCDPSSAADTIISVNDTSNNDTQSNLSINPSCDVGYGSNWMDYGTSECGWYTQNRGEHVSTCNDDEEYISMVFVNNNLHGTIPAELSLLSNMDYFLLAKDEIEGTIPQQLYSDWTKLRSFSVFHTRLSGSLHSDIGLWNQTLETLFLLNNEMTGSIPEKLFSLSKLQELTLFDNDFSGTLSRNVLDLSSLKVLELVKNKLFGNIPSEVGLLGDLEVLSLQQNSFVGTLPTELGILSNLFFLSLGNNNFESTLPSELGLISKYLTFSVKDNPYLSGSIPSELGIIPIENIYLQGTNLTGTIPELWCNSSKILRWDCSPSFCGCDCPCNQ